MSSRSTDVLYTAGNTGRHVVVRRSSPEFWPSTFAPVDRSRTADEFVPHLYDDVAELDSYPDVDDRFIDDRFVDDDVDLTTDLRHREVNRFDEDRDEYRYDQGYDQQGSVEYEYEVGAHAYDDEIEYDEIDSKEFGHLVRYDHVEPVARLLWRVAGAWGVVYLLVATSAFWR